MRFSRRNFIAGSSSLYLTSQAIVPAWAQSVDKKNLVIVMLRGGMDGLASVPLIGNRLLDDLRPDIHLQKPLRISSDFGLHPRLKHFKKLWDEDKASVVHATSIPYTGRSHFEGQYLMESGGTVAYQESTGWLGRALERHNRHSLSLSLPMPLILRGTNNIDNFMPAQRGIPKDDLLSVLVEDYNDDPILAEALSAIRRRPLSMSSMRKSPHGDDSKQLAKVAARQLADPDGPTIAVFDIVGFDTHSGQGDDWGRHGNMLSQFDDVVKILQEGMGKAFESTLIASLTEFGRTLAQNGGSGTDHGYGTSILMAGGLLQKSKVISDWPGIQKKELFEGRDLQSTIDARAVYASIVGHVTDTDHGTVVKDAFFGADLPDMTKRIFG